MSQNLEQLFRDEAERIGVPPPRISAIVADGWRRSKVRRTRSLIALAASVAVVAGGLVGVTRHLADDAHGSLPDPAGTVPTPAGTVPTPSAMAAGGPLDVSGSGVAGQRFGTDADEVLATVTARLGEPDLSSGPQHYFQVPGHDTWLEDADDPLSWQYPVTLVICFVCYA